MRDKLIHRYFGVDASIVWETAVSDVPNLIQGLTAMLDDLDQQDR